MVLFVPAVSAIVTAGLLPIVFLSHLIAKSVQMLKSANLHTTKTAPVAAGKVADNSPKTQQNILNDQLEEKGIMLAYSNVVAAAEMNNVVNVTV